MQGNNRQESRFHYSMRIIKQRMKYSYSIIILFCLITFQFYYLLSIFYFPFTLQQNINWKTNQEYYKTIYPKYFLPKIYPNGNKNKYSCNLLSIQDLCGLNTNNGCMKYPQLFPIGEILKNWAQDKIEIPSHIFSSICRFNISSPMEYELAQIFQELQVPFIIYGIPELNHAIKIWTDQYLISQLGPEELYKVHVSNTSHFLYASQKKGENFQPTYESKWLTYESFIDHMNISKQFYYFMIKAQDIFTRASFIYKDLSFFNPKSTTLYHTFFIHEKEFAMKKGMRCRIGGKGIVTEGHVDAGRNMIAMIRGKKRYILAPPSVCSCLHIRPYTSPSARHTSMNWSLPVDMMDIQTKSCLATEVIVNTGEILYVPSFWFHHLIALENTIQCNARSGLTNRQELEPFLQSCGAIP